MNTNFTTNHTNPHEQKRKKPFVFVRVVRGEKNHKVRKDKFIKKTLY